MRSLDRYLNIDSSRLDVSHMNVSRSDYSHINVSKSNEVPRLDNSYMIVSK